METWRVVLAIALGLFFGSIALWMLAEGTGLLAFVRRGCVPLPVLPKAERPPGFKTWRQRVLPPFAIFVACCIYFASREHGYWTKDVATAIVLCIYSPAAIWLFFAIYIQIHQDGIFGQDGRLRPILARAKPSNWFQWPMLVLQAVIVVGVWRICETSPEPIQPDIDIMGGVGLALFATYAVRKTLDLFGWAVQRAGRASRRRFG